MPRKIERVNAWARKIAADFMKTRFSSDTVVSVARVDSSEDAKNIFIYVSVFPDAKEKSAFGILKNQEKEFRAYAKQFMKMKYLPTFEFKLDRSAQAAQKIEELLGKI